MGDPLDEHDEADDRRAEMEERDPDSGELLTHGGAAKSTLPAGGGAAANDPKPPNNRERVRVFDRDHPGLSSRKAGEALGIDYRQVAFLRRQMAKAKAAEDDKGSRSPRAQGEQTRRLADVLLGGESPNIQKKAEDQAAQKSATHVSDALAGETNKLHDELLSLGRFVREWYVDRGLHNEFVSSADFVADAVDFWWNNRDRVGELRDTITELQEAVVALRAFVDPDLQYERYVDGILSKAADCAVAGIKVPSVIWTHLLDQALARRDTSRGLPSSVTSLPTGVMEEQHGTT